MGALLDAVICSYIAVVELFCDAGVGVCRDDICKACALLDAIICSYIVEFCDV